ncbi:basic helix-loop-helix and HMG box domain-containing protein 1 [Notechis scutatus]|uniref:Basic helix-loop-helix and HMG box domain-containing protein 1 n=1 Tax=Notechis scutatus TaxID=8663 RepID=A0A6J1VTD7_9SAUR|nr:basic helix-loop-helix and HMG box domain-containing protein 1 [Notechis scutatus]
MFMKMRSDKSQSAYKSCCISFGEMWDQIGRVCSEEMQAKSNNFKQNCDDRRKCNNYTNTLKELAQMLPIPLRTSCKRLTKKEILLRVLRYIEHLQTSIDRARSLLQGHGEEQKAGSQPVAKPALKREHREVTPRAKNPKPLAVYKKPRKRRRMRKSDRCGGVNKKVCKYLALEAGKDSAHAVPHLEEESWNFDGDKEYKDENTFSVYKAQMAYNKLHQYSGGPGHTLVRQELVHYHSSCEEEEEEGPRASPWLSIQSPLKFSNGNVQLSSPGIGTRSHSCSDLGLSPSLFSSPARLLPPHILQGVPEELSPVLFEDACLSPQCSSFSHTPAGTLLRKSAFTLDHCYLSYSEAGKTESSPMSRVNEILSSWSEQIQEEPPPVRAEGPGSSSEENSDSTWTPSFPRAKALSGGPRRKKNRKKQKQKKKKGAGAGRRARRPPAGAEKRSNASSPPLQMKKKCVNGFIMFCRLNRKHFIRTCPGMASTAATRELAQLWRMMTKQERKPYCMKARQFSRLNNRIVRDDFSSGDEEAEPPKPFHLLLAEKSIPGTQTVGNVSLLGCIP